MKHVAKCVTCFNSPIPRTPAFMRFLLAETAQRIRDELLLVQTQCCLLCHIPTGTGCALTILSVPIAKQGVSTGARAYLHACTWMHVHSMCNGCVRASNVYARVPPTHPLHTVAAAAHRTCCRPCQLLRDAPAAVGSWGLRRSPVAVESFPHAHRPSAPCH